MGREIKFRAWDNTDKTMKFFDFYKIHCGVYHPNHWKDSTGLACELDNKLRYPDELMQYTGLKDKNGKEIYEGDIVKLAVEEEQVYDPYEGIPFGKPIYTNEKVVYETYGFFAGDYGLGEFECEIIGNIYDNPELLGGHNG